MISPVLINSPYRAINSPSLPSPSIVSGAKKTNISFLGAKSSHGLDYAGADIPIRRWDKADRLFSVYKKSLEGSKEQKLSVLRLLEDENLSGEEAFGVLLKITSNKETAAGFIEEITRDENGKIDPKKSNEVTKFLIEKLGGKENFERWYTAPGGYLGAFKRYGEDMYKKAGSVEELCRWLPNWGPWALRRKYREDKNLFPVIPGRDAAPRWTDSFTLGKLPKRFENKEAFRNLVSDLRCDINSQDGRNINEIVSRFGFKNAEVVGSGSSPKYKVVLDNKYVIKMDKYKDNFTGSDYYNDIKDSEPDSTFLNAMVDYYISAYEPDFTSKMYFYDDYASASLYEFVRGKKPVFLSDGAGFNTQTEDFKEKFKRVNDIGINFTDFYSGNFVETKDSIKCIDSGHSVYFDILRPGIGGLTMSLPSRTGFNPLEFYGRLNEF